MIRVLFLMSLWSALYGAEINTKFYQGDETELNIYYTQMQQEIELSKVPDAPLDERLENEKNLLSKLQELIQSQPKPLVLENHFSGKKTITLKEFLELFNFVAQTLASKESTKNNQLVVQDKLAFLKNRIENLVESQKENLRLYQLQFAYYKLIQRKDKALVQETSTIVNQGTSLLHQHLHKVVFDTNSSLLRLEKLEEELKTVDTKFIALNLTKERDLLSSENISTKLKLNLEKTIKTKDKYLKETVDTLILLALQAYQQNNIDLLLEKQKKMRIRLTEFSEKNELYEAKYLLIKELSNTQLNSTDHIILTVKEMSQTLYTNFNHYLHEPLFVYDERPILASNIFKALFILIFGFIIAKFYHRQFIKLHNRRKDMSMVVIKVIANIGFTIIFLISISIAITNVGLSLANLTVIAGALSIGVGFALRSVVSNYIAGIVIMSEKNVKIGNYIRVSNLSVGKVIDIGLRATIIRTIDNTHIIIPNSDLLEKDVLNLNLEDRIRRIYVPFKIPYGSDVKKISTLIVETVTASKIKFLRDVPGKKPNVWMRNMGESFIELDLFIWIEGYRPSVKSSLLILIHDTLLEHHIQMPFPQLDVHMKRPNQSSRLSHNVLGANIQKKRESQEDAKEPL